MHFIYIEMYLLEKKKHSATFNSLKMQRKWRSTRLFLIQKCITANQNCASDIWAATCDFQQCDILTSVDSDKPGQPPFKLRNSKCCSVSSLTLCWSHIPYCWKSYATAHLSVLINLVSVYWYQVLWQTVKILMKCSWCCISSGSTLFAKIKRLRGQKYHICFEW